MLNMLKTSAKLFHNFHTVQTSIYRSWNPIASLTNKVNLNSRRSTHSTIDPKDIFQADPNIAKTFWDPEGVFKALHAFNYFRLPYIRDRLVKTAPGDKYSTCLKGKKILDVGCGGGLLSEGLAKYGADVTGVDASKPLLDLAQDHSSKNIRLADNKPTYILSTIEEHCTKYPDTYDAIIASEVIEHVTEKELFVESCVRATKPGGKLIFTTPNRTRFAQLFIIRTFEDILRCYPKGAHHFEMFMRPNELQLMLEMNDCYVELIKGYFYYPWSNSWAWTDTKMFSFAIEAIKSPK
ncbi:ubiquinone biosynthesis O-methyltransferase, mitochondrial [Bicyclus anynana]|uniref:Ubiquinone biosynthesis O-methyltransferase, mitochondrial n=1 Tax=Bicyclus anynana TaxID=110368 RepID=A0A6J1NPX5_BICAN|nr:ubiquinone biosynthesis O-methyltransferase, mitochondrial [Bicyclus anynana]